MRWALLLALVACGTSANQPCDPAAEGCSADQTCVWASPDFVCVETCFDSGSCTDGACTGSGSSCENCRDYIPFCE